MILKSFRGDVEAGLCGKELGSKLRGYPKGQVEISEKEHIERAKAIAMAQSEAAVAGQDKMAARGVADLDADPQSGKREKENSRETALRTSTRKRVRGEGNDA